MVHISFILNPTYRFKVIKTEFKKNNIYMILDMCQSELNDSL